MLEQWPFFPTVIAQSGAQLFLNQEHSSCEVSCVLIVQSKFLFCAKTCFSATKKLQLSQYWFHNTFCGKFHVLNAALYAAWVGDSISALVYRVHVRVSKEGLLQPLSVSSVKKLGHVASRHFSKMDEKEKDLEKGQVDSGRGPVVEVSGLTRDVSPPVPELEVQSLQFHLSPEMPVITLSLSLQCCVMYLYLQAITFYFSFHCLSGAVDLKDPPSFMTLMESQRGYMIQSLLNFIKSTYKAMLLKKTLFRL